MTWISKNDIYLSESEMLNNANEQYKQLKSAGWSDSAIFALLGNERGESTVNPALHEQGGGTGYGLVQWTPGSIIKNWCSSHGYSITDGEAQTKKILEEVHDGSQWIKTSTYNISFAEWTTDTKHDLDFMVNAFICNYERPATNNHPERVTYAKWFAEKVTKTDMTKIINSACDWACAIAKDDTHGYDQTNRWGADYDCSSFVISAYEHAGIKLKEAGASYTGNMQKACESCGFKKVDWKADEKNLQKGDILLNTVHHVSLYLGGGQVVEASINELGTVTGGQTGDQTGKEISIKSFYNFPWDVVLRLGTYSGGGSSGGGSSEDKKGEVFKAIEKSSFNIKRLKQKQVDFLKTLSFGDSVKIKQCFQRNKRIIGVGINGKRLTMTYGKFIIDSVNKSGCILLKNNKESKHIFYTIKPDFIEKI